MIIIIDKEKVDTKKLEKRWLIQLLDISTQTFENWVREGCPCVSSEKGLNSYYDLGEVSKWRYTKFDKKKLPKESNNSEKPSSPEDTEFALREKIMRQDLRKKTLENDEREGMLVDKKQMEDRYFRLGRALRDNLMSKDSVYGPQLNMVTGFEASVYLRKEFEKFCNSIADLNLLDDEALAREFHEYFMMGVNYKNVN